MRAFAIEHEDTRRKQTRSVAEGADEWHLAPRDEQCAARGKRTQQAFDDARSRLLAEVNQHILADNELVLPGRQTAHHVARHEAHLRARARHDAERIRAYRD